jgi:peptide deformylase
MAILKVARLGHPVLRAKASAVPPAEIASVRIQTLIDDMFETMSEYQGIGLAAPQVHESVRLFVAGVRRGAVVTPMTDDVEMPFVALINPEILPVGEDVESNWEGCLSIPDIRGKVERPRAVRVRALDRSGRRIELVAHGLPARVIQHECDHLDGILYPQRMADLSRLAFVDEIRRAVARPAESGAGTASAGGAVPMEGT